MIKFRYKRKEPAVGGGNGGTSTAASPGGKSVADSKAKEVKSDPKTQSLKREMAPKTQIDEKAKSISDEEYLAGCIKAVAVSIRENGESNCEIAHRDH